MALLHHIRRLGNFRSARREDRMSFDEMVRSTDIALDVEIVILLIAFALAFWYLHGAIGPDSTAPPL